MVREVIDEGKAAVRFLTRLPLPGPEAWPDHALAASAPFFPLVGALIGALGALTFTLALGLGLPPMPAAIVAIATLIVATGALHEDGLADLGDGLGGRTPAARIEIMRDSRLGTFGAIALILALLLRIGALTALAGTAPVGAVLIAAGAVSRAALPVLMAALPPVRREGLGAWAGRPHPARVAAGVLIALLLTLVLLDPRTATLGLAGAAGGTLAIALLARRALGGQTGDVLGATQQLAEIGFLLAVLTVSG